MPQCTPWHFLSFHALHAGTCPQAAISIKPGGHWLRTYHELPPKRLKCMHMLHSMLQQSAISCSKPNSQQGMSAVLAPITFPCCAATLLQDHANVGKGLAKPLHSFAASCDLYIFILSSVAALQWCCPFTPSFLLLIHPHSTTGVTVE